MANWQLTTQIPYLYLGLANSHFVCLTVIDPSIVEGAHPAAILVLHLLLLLEVVQVLDLFYDHRDALLQRVQDVLVWIRPTEVQKKCEAFI